MVKKGGSGGKRLHRWLQETGLILIGTACLALAVNALRPEGLSILPWRTFSEGSGASGPVVRAIPLDEALAQYNSGKALFVDARSKQDYVDGHIEGAISLPNHQFNEAFGGVAGLLAQFEEIITYCDGESCPLAKSLAEQLRELGYQKVYYMVNGWTLWRERGLPVSAGGGASS
jgi:rhodanese-related sulfurtransferase